MITAEQLTQRLDELTAQRDQLVQQIYQAQANVNAFNGAIEEIARLRDLVTAETPAPPAPTDD